MINYYKECRKCRDARPGVCLGFAKQPLDFKLKAIHLFNTNIKIAQIARTLLEEFPLSKINYPKLYSWHSKGSIDLEKDILFPQ
jgi:hypothetical protein